MKKHPKACQELSLLPDPAKLRFSWGHGLESAHAKVLGLGQQAFEHVFFFLCSFQNEFEGMLFQTIYTHQTIVYAPWQQSMIELSL
jgi:hypothetical protein